VAGHEVKEANHPPRKKLPSLRTVLGRLQLPNSALVEASTPSLPGEKTSITLFQIELE